MRNQSRVLQKISCKASVDGRDLLVAGFSINLACNSIPSVTLRVSAIPVNESGSEASSLGPTNLYSLSSLYNDLLPKTYGLNTNGSVSIRISGVPKENDSTIDLKDWILSDVSLGGINQYASPSMSVTLSHPAIKLSHGGVVYETPENSYDILLKTVASSIPSNSGLTLLSMMAKSYRFASENNYIPLLDKSSGVEDIRRRLSEDADNILKYLSTDTGLLDLGLNAGGKNRRSGSIDSILRYAFLMMCKPSAWTGSVWTQLIGTLVPELLMVIKPTFTKSSLRLDPFVPWKKPSLSISGSDAFEIGLPSRNPDPILGVAVESEAYISNLSFTPEKKLPVRSDTYYNDYYSFILPSGGDAQTDTSFGRYILIPQSSIVSQLINCDAPTAVDENMYHAESVIPAKSIISANKKYASGVLSTIYRSGVTTHISMPISFTDSHGQLLMPGESVSVIVDGSDIMHGNIVSVLHESGAGPSSTHTIVELSHIRNGDGKGEKMGEIDKSPVY